jgi:hypothetical protein
MGHIYTAKMKNGTQIEDARFKLSELDKGDIVRRYVQGELVQDIANKYDISRKTVQRIIEPHRIDRQMAENVTVGIAEGLVDYIPRDKRPELIDYKDKFDSGHGGAYVPLIQGVLNMSHDLLRAAAYGASNAKRLHSIAEARIAALEGNLVSKGGANDDRCFVNAEPEDAVKMMRPIMAAITAANAASQNAMEILKLNVDALKAEDAALSGADAKDIPMVEIVFKSPHRKGI